jgi:hypothetical protein
MKRLGSVLAALAAAALFSGPALAATTLADFRGGGQSLEHLLAHIHKKVKVVVKRPGDERHDRADTKPPTSSSSTPSGSGSGDVQPR